MNRKLKFVALALALAAAGKPSILQAKDHFLSIGGGYEPAGNQLSIESNVLFFQEVLGALRPDRPWCEIYFADGDHQQPDLQFHETEADKLPSPARRMMAEIFGEIDLAKLRYRNHRVREVKGATEPNVLARRFRQLGRQLQKGDRLIVYVDGHGGESYRDYDYDYGKEEWVEKKSQEGVEIPYNKFDTQLMLWDNESVKASEFNRWLDRIGRDVPVILIMGQCYAGGFSHAIFHGNNAELGLSPHARCGFFAQVNDRPAAGCTPDDDIEEYTSLFWSGLGGRSPDGKPVTTADYDANGKTSFAEAHAYAILTSDTGDVPVTTSGALLRHYSELGVKDSKKSNDGDVEDDPIKAIVGAIRAAREPDDEKKLRRASGAISAFASSARPEQIAILQGLREKLGLDPTATVESLRLKLLQLKSAANVAKVQMGVANETFGRTQSEAQTELKEIWPELEHAYSPLAAELTSERAEEFVKLVESLSAYDALCKAYQSLEEYSDKALKAEGEQARAERLLQTLEEIVLAENLPKVAPAEVTARYQQIIELEHQTLD